MIIHSLNLVEGGGVVPQNDISAPENEASVIIGIGGTGVSTIKKIKKKIYSQLQPSNPGDPVARYDMIRLLAIDTDETIIDEAYSDSDLDKANEFVSIHTPKLANMLDPNSNEGKPKLRKNPVYNTWMSIDQISSLLGSAGAGGNRQMGRFMLMQHAEDVYKRIETALKTAIEGMKVSGQINVHIIAGISGGTGSGCFIDVCYLVQKVLDDNGYGGKLFGYFYLPDVVIAKDAVRNDTAKTKINRRNGFAAFRELDYLMNLEGEHDEFSQIYPGSIGAFRTSRGPVDMCHLISATDAKGNLPLEAFDYSLNVVADYIMAYLAHVENNSSASAEGALTMQGHLANILDGVATINRSSGANLNYTILGASNAEVPSSQIATYLAQGFIKKVSGISTNTPSAGDLSKFVTSVGLTYDRIARDVKMRAADPSTLEQELKDLRAKDCKDALIDADHPHPVEISIPCDKWYENHVSKVAENVKALSKALETYAAPTMQKQNPYISTIHRELLNICLNKDGKGGPKFAARLLSNTEKDLTNVINDLISENEKRIKAENEKGYLAKDLLEDRDEFLRPKIFGVGDGGSWKKYIASMLAYQEHRAALNDLAEIDKLLHELKEQVQKLYSLFYQKMSKLYDNLEDTVRENDTFLNNPDAVTRTNAYTRRIIQLSDVKSDLDKSLEMIEPFIASADFVNYLITEQNQPEWMSESDSRIGRLISRFMIDKFHTELDRTIDYYILRKFPDKSDSEVMKDVKDSILETGNTSAEPMYWLTPAYTLNTNTAFASNVMTIPSSSTYIVGAAQQFRDAGHENYAIRAAGIGDRVFALRFYSGIPLYAYQGVELMYNEYKKELDGGHAGLHLFEHNTVAESKVQKTPEDLKLIKRTAWGNYLPYPTPYSISHINGQEPTSREAEQIEAFQKARELGIIAKNDANNWCIYSNPKSAETIMKSTRDMFVEEGKFSLAKAETRKKELVAAKDNWTSRTICKEILLLGSCTIVEGYQDDVLLDCYMHAPVLIDEIRSNVDKYQLLCEDIENISTIIQNEKRQSEMLQVYASALLTGVLKKDITKITYETINYFDMKQDETLSAKPDDLDVNFMLYKGYVGFKALKDSDYLRIKEETNGRLNNLKEGDDALALALRRQLKVVLPNIANVTETMDEARRDEIRLFYKTLRAAFEGYAAQFEGYVQV